jgi:hypothetical protein
MHPLLRYPRPLLRTGLLGLLAGGMLAVSGSAPQAAAADRTPEFQFVRLAYADGGGGGGGFGRGRFGRNASWLTDAPEAEQHFLQGVKRLTRLDAGSDSIGVRPLDPEIFDYPFLYAVEVGRWELSEADGAQLREYLERGGFLMVDDFHGSYEWESFMDSLRRVFPDRPVVEIQDSSEAFHVLFDLDQRVQIPGVVALMNGVTYEKDGQTPHWRGVFDDSGRLMIAINFNMDLGDAWEHADNPGYPQPLTALAYRFGINYILYSMTH